MKQLTITNNDFDDQSTSAVVHEGIVLTNKICVLTTCRHFFPNIPTLVSGSS